MKNVILASTSALFGGQYLDYLKNEIVDLFQKVDEIIFIPYARPGGCSHDEYTKKVTDFFAGLGIRVIGLHSFQNPAEAMKNAKGFFTGGGNTFLLTKTLHQLGLMEVLKSEIEEIILFKPNSLFCRFKLLKIKNFNILFAGNIICKKSLYNTKLLYSKII